MAATAQEIWKWTLAKEAIAPCFVRDVLSMRESVDNDVDFFWLGYTPCRSVLLVGMVVAVQTYDKRAIYTIDDGTSVIDCVLRHPTPPKTKDPPATSPSKKAQRSPPKKTRVDKDGKAPNLIEPPPPITEPGYPVRVVGKVVRHHESRQIHADTINPCPSSLDEINHLKRVVDLHKTKYSLAIPFVIPPPQPTTISVTGASTLLPSSSTSQTDAGLFSSDASRPGPSTVNVPNSLPTTNYTLPTPRIPLQNRPSPIPMHNANLNHGVGHVPSSPTASSIASSTPSSPCKTSSPVKDTGFGEPPPKPKLRHPSRLHTRDLSANTFRLYVKHYMDNAPPLFPWSTDDEHGAPEAVRTPTKRSRHAEEEDDEERTPRPSFPRKTTQSTGHWEVPALGFTLSHLRRVPELALLASRVVRAETRRREKSEREKARKNGDHDCAVSQSKSQSHSQSTMPMRSVNRNGKPHTSTSTSSTAPPDPPRKKMKRLFSWAVVKLYEEGSIVLWDGDVRPLPIPPPSDDDGDTRGLWKRTVGNDTSATLACRSSSVYSSPSRCPSTSLGLSSTSFLYSSSASVSLYSHSHSPRRPSARTRDTSGTHDDADPANLSDPPMDEESYVPLTARFLVPYVRQALGVLREGRVRERQRGGVGSVGSGGSSDPTAEAIVGCLRRMDGRWARVGVWAVEEALEVLREG